MNPTQDRPAAELDSQLNTTGGGRTQDPTARHAPVTRRGLPSPVTDSRSRAGEGTKTPAVGAGASPASAAGSRALSGAEWRAAAAKAGRRRPGKATPKAAAKVTIPPAPATGAALAATATCLGRCDWTAGPGDPAEVDKAAEKHTKAAPKHPTNVVSAVAGIGGAA